MEFFRHCPGCGRRFHIKLVDKKIVSFDREPVVERRVGSPGYPTPLSTGYVHGPMPAMLLVEGTQVIMDIEEFRYEYKCSHCGHEWSEKHLEEHREH